MNTKWQPNNLSTCLKLLDHYKAYGPIRALQGKIEPGIYGAAVAIIA